MEAKTKKSLIIGGSIAAVVLLAGGITLGVVLGGKTENTISNNDFGIGAFSNLESFTNDGFNNGVLTSSQDYLANYEDNSTYSSDYPERTKLDQKTSHYSDDGHEYVDMLTEYYDSNDIIISAGFQVGGALMGSAGSINPETGELEGAFDGVFSSRDGVQTDYANSNDKAFVLLDDAVLPYMYSNTASISYAAEGAGYLAGMAGAVYTEYDAITNGKDVANIVMWGGMPFPTVYDFMSGFAAAIEWANTTYSGATIGTGTYKEITLWSGGTDAGEGISATNTYGTSDANTWYSWGFDAAGGNDDVYTATKKSENAIAADASIIFPVAGGNTTIAENVISNTSGSTTKLIGVDADATLASTKDELYIGTAQKNLVTGGQLGLWAMDDFDGDGIRNFQDDVDANDTYGLEITSAEGDYTTWTSAVADTTGMVGMQFRGNIDNGGVGFQYDDATGQSAGLNPDFALAIQTVFGVAKGEESDALNEYLGLVPAGDSIDAADPEFIPEGW